MRRPWIVFVCAGALLVGCPAAQALDCAKAQQRVDRIICATPQLRKADEAMSAAYFKLLRETTDPEFHEAVIRSQRRWVKTRLGGLDPFGVEAMVPDEEEARSILLVMTRDRLADLKSGKLIRTVEQQRAAAMKDSGGAFAGFDTSCYILPPPHGRWLFACFNIAHRQHRDRICSSATEWATGHYTERRYLSIIKEGRPVLAAACSLGESDVDQCPEPDDDAERTAIAHWTTTPADVTNFVASRPDRLWKYDPDIDPSPVAEPWMQDCLFAPVFPPPGQTRSTSPPKP